MNFLKQIFSYSYLFTIDRSVLSKGDYVLLGFGIGGIISAIALGVFRYISNNPLKKEFVGKLFRPVLFLGVMELLWFGARYEYVSFFGSHFVGIVLIVIAVLWFLKGVWWRLKKYPQIFEQQQKQAIKEKYLKPKR
jgi:hypothetical protein